MVGQDNLRLVLLGLPGSGKGTLADSLKKKYNIPHISTGNLLREAISKNTPLGKEAQSYVQSGKLVQDSLIIDLVKEEITKNHGARGFILDGFPRNLAQVEKLDIMLKELDLELSFAIEIKLNEEILVKRLTGRRTCSKCGALYNIYFNPSQISEVCDVCQGKLFRRGDDNVKVVNNRIKIYWSNISPVIEYYQKNRILRVINGNQEALGVFSDICKVIEES